MGRVGDLDSEKAEERGNRPTEQAVDQDDDPESVL